MLFEQQNPVRTLTSKYGKCPARALPHSKSSVGFLRPIEMARGLWPLGTENYLFCGYEYVDFRTQPQVWIQIHVPQKGYKYTFFPQRKHPNSHKHTKDVQNHLASGKYKSKPGVHLCSHCHAIVRKSENKNVVKVGVVLG